MRQIFVAAVAGAVLSLWYLWRGPWACFGLYAFVSVTEKFSSPSTRLSLRSATVIVRVFCPGANVTVPLVAV